jgi:putative transposase
MIDTNHPVSLTRQAELLALSRSSLYYRKPDVPATDLALMRRIDELHLAHPHAGSRMLRDLLRQECIEVGRRHVQTLMRKMGIRAIYRAPKTSQPNAEHRLFPYLLRNGAIDRPNQVWSADITYVPMRRGFLYLVAILDWHSRKVLAHQLSNTLTADFCIEAVRDALARYGTPEIFNTDQGAQFTSIDFVAVLQANDIAISMDGRGRWLDNVMVERLWRSVKYEEVYLHAYDDVAAAQVGIDRYLDFYNRRRPHRSHGGKTPDAIYFANDLAMAA